MLHTHSIICMHGMFRIELLQTTLLVTGFKLKPTLYISHLGHRLTLRYDLYI